jgi:hypothetical protein
VYRNKIRLFRTESCIYYDKHSVIRVPFEQNRINRFYAYSVSYLFQNCSATNITLTTIVHRLINPLHLTSSVRPSKMYIYLYRVYLLRLFVTLHLYRAITYSSGTVSRLTAYTVNITFSSGPEILKSTSESVSF